MWYAKIVFLLNYLVILLKISYVQNSTSFSNIKWDHDLYSIGDIHGDMDAFLKILINEKIIDENGNIIKENTLIVMTGDVLDPNYDDINILFFIQIYNDRGKDSNSKILLLLGNHEVKNLCLDFKYKKSDKGKYRNRNNMFKKNEILYNYLMNSPLVVKVNDITFSHAGVLPFYAFYGIDFMNEEGKKEIKNNCEVLKEKRKRKEELCICCEDGPTLTRYYSIVNDNIFKRSMVCSTLNKSLIMLKSSRMVVGHTVQKNKRVNSFCNERLLLADTGISKWKKGVISYVQYFKDGTYVVRYIDR
ncbi:shewanella-like protein phosphatase 2, putative [Plasmodium malariae]|uniref:Shewanella-like protein phosphatase 2, putative n=1 Tax=Plasmodium malariae TaxID=5858 RepID=A0A1C3KEC2_PLAMA|nr:shewanella-like protein phosphatase 2, putative [Plasmodium malariae]